MVTYLAGTDGVSASEAICDYLLGTIDEGDHVEAVTIQKLDPEVNDTIEEALAVFEDRLGGIVSVESRRVYRGRDPEDEMPLLADEVGADEIVVGLRRHSRAERVIYGSVSHALLKRANRPIVLVPLEEGEPPVG